MSLANKHHQGWLARCFKNCSACWLYQELRLLPMREPLNTAFYEYVQLYAWKPHKALSQIRYNTEFGSIKIIWAAACCSVSPDLISTDMSLERLDAGKLIVRDGFRGDYITVFTAASNSRLTFTIFLLGRIMIYFISHNLSKASSNLSNGKKWTLVIYTAQRNCKEILWFIH